ncbi:iron ABC transporter permease [Lysinibacillus fusiformis]|uniref:iron ABC transporter permease n=1 Tax=Lysinibacillus fusiformis TaxID=28031 RepID=UPI00215263AD|nr:iron ABC transporter permease [Lysinibacillus fusiformis]
MSNYRTVRTKSERISFQIAKRTSGILLLLSLLLVIITVLGLSAGSEFIHPITVVRELLGYGNGEYDFVLHTLRLPRVLMALLVGAALGVAGLILQGIIRNPLAAPDIIGVTSGVNSSPSSRQ